MWCTFRCAEHLLVRVDADMKSQIKRGLAVSIAALCAVIMMCGPTPVLAADEWSPPQNLSAPASVAAYPQITSSSDGTKLTAIWYRSNGTHNIIQTASSTDGGTTWTTPQNLSATGHDAFRPQIVSSSNGTTLTAIWEHNSGPGWIVQSASSTTSGTTWTTPQNLSVAGLNAYNPRIVSNNDGTTLTAVWQRDNGSHWIIQSASSTNGGTTWTTPQDLSATGQDAFRPQIVSSNDGTTLTAIWERNNGANYVVQTASSTTSGTTWTTPQNLSVAGANAEVPQISSSSDGTTLTAVWQRDNGSHSIIQSTSSTTSGTTWTTPQDLSASGRNANYPQIVSSNEGTTLTAIWRRNNGSRDIIQTTSSTDGGSTWTTPQDLSGSGQHADSPQIASSSNGLRLTAIWFQYDGAHDIIQTASSTDGGTTWTTPTNISAAGATAVDPRIASNNDGTKVIAIWQRIDGPNIVIQTSSLRRRFPSETTPPAQIVSLHHANLDPNGGTCVTNGIATTTSARTPFLGYSYIPGAEECTRTGFTFQGWAATTKPDTVIPLPLLRGWFDGIWRYFIANSYDLTAVWKPTG